MLAFGVLLVAAASILWSTVSTSKLDLDNTDRKCILDISPIKVALPLLVHS